MTDQQQKLGIVVYVEDQATGKLTKVKAEVAGLGTAGTTAGRGFATGASSIEKSAGRISGALNHAKGAIGGLLTGPLGILGLGAGIFSLGTFLDSGLRKASDFAVQIEKLTGLTGESAQSMGALILLADRYGISEERLGMIVGFTEKTLGKLNETQAKAAKVGKSAALQALEQRKLEIELHGGKTKTIDLLIKEQKARDALNASNQRAIVGQTKLTALDAQYGISLVDKSGKVKNFSQVLSAVADYYNGTAAQSTKAALAASVFGRGYADLIPILRLGSKGIAEQEQAYKDLGLQLGTNTQNTLKAYQASIRQVGEAVDILQLQLGLALAPMVTKAANAITLFLEHGGAQQIVGVFEGAAHFAEALGSAVMTYVVPAFGMIQGAWNALPEPLRTMLLAGEVGGKAFKFIFGIDLSPTHLAADLMKGVGGGILSSLGKSVFQRGSSPANPLYVTGTGIGSIPGGGPGGGLPLLGMGGLILAGVAAAEVGIAEWLRQQLHPTTSGDLIQNYTPSEAADYHSGRKSVEDIMSDRAAITTGFAGANAREDRTNFELQAVRANLVAIHNAIKASIDKLDNRLAHPLLPHSKVNAQLHAALRIAKSSESTDAKIRDLEAINRDLVAGGHKTSHYVQDLISVEKRKKLTAIVHVTDNVTVFPTKGGGTVTVRATRSTEGTTYAGKAAGGPAPVNQPYWVGEHGPELRFDRTPGYILDAEKSKTYARTHGLENAIGHAGSSTAIAAIQAAMDRLGERIADLSARPVYAYASARDVVAQQHRRGSSRPRQIGW